MQPAASRDLFAALEQGERLVDLLEELLQGEGVSVALGGRGVFVGSGDWLTKPEISQVNPIPSNPKIRSAE